MAGDQQLLHRGAQSSARRLLLALRERGVAVRAATLQEHPEHPTVGRAALLQEGVRVEAIPPPEALSPTRAVQRLLAHLDADPPEAVLLWNALAEHKLRLADALQGLRVVDVSPGEMYFASLRRFFAGWRGAAELPVCDARSYGRRLHALVVKYAAEAPDAAAVGAPVTVVANGVPLPRAGRAGERRGPRGVGDERARRAAEAPGASPRRAPPRRTADAALRAARRRGRGDGLRGLRGGAARAGRGPPGDVGGELAEVGASSTGSTRS